MKTTFVAKPAKPGAGKTCAVCGQKHGPTFNFRRTLESYGVKGEQATVNCVRQLALGQRKAKKRALKTTLGAKKQVPGR